VTKLSQRLVAVEGEARGAQEIELREAPKYPFQPWKIQTFQLPKKVGCTHRGVAWAGSVFRLNLETQK